MDRLQRYQAAYSPGADAYAIGPEFRASFTAVRLDSSLIYDRHMNDVGHERSTARIEKDGFDHLVFTAVLVGSFEVATVGSYGTVPIGAISVLDLSSSLKTRSRNAHLITLSVARDRLSDKTMALIGSDGLVIEGTMAGFLQEHLKLVARSAKFFDTMQARDIARVTISMLDAAVRHPLASTFDRKDTGSDGQQIEDFIEANLADPDLSITQIITQTGLSRATIYRHFSAFGGLSIYIRQRRLRRLAIDVVVSNKSLECLSMENGFASKAHASRVFHQTYGIRPGEYRRTMREHWREGVPDALMEVFLKEVLPT